MNKNTKKNTPKTHLSQPSERKLLNDAYWEAVSKQYTLNRACPIVLYTLTLSHYLFKNPLYGSVG